MPGTHILHGRWRLVINQDKTLLVYFRHRSIIRSSVVFNLGSIVLPYTDEYKYLGLMFDEHMTFKEAVGVLTQLAGRALGSVVNIVKHRSNLGFHTFTQLYTSCVYRVSDYASGVWGFRNIQVVILCIIEP